jgi:CDP-diacylglycerol--glycerol-3-phosphate 3-phosphatidyltransferase
MKFLAKMNLPNKLTSLRMLCVIAIIVFGIIDFSSPELFTNNELEKVFDVKRLVILILFAFGSFTDFLDGYIARKYNLVTTFGKFMDPIADKLLVNTTFIFLSVWAEIPVIVTIIMIARDTIVDAIRLVMMDQQVVIAASKWGKAKTVTQMIALIVVLVYNFPFFYITNLNLGLYFSYLAALISLISGIDYFWKNRKTLLEGMN